MISRRLSSKGVSANSAKSNAGLDHHRATMERPTASWRMPRRRPRKTGTRTVESDQHKSDVDLNTAWRPAAAVIETATFQRGERQRWRRWLLDASYRQIILSSELLGPTRFLSQFLRENDPFDVCRITRRYYPYGSERSVSYSERTNDAALSPLSISSANDDEKRLRKLCVCGNDVGRKPSAKHDSRTW